MRVDLPDGLVAFAREFSRFKTPAVRTQGWAELPHETRGEGDVLDTIGSLMLWRFLVERDVPATYLLTGRQGDEADIRVGTPPGGLDLNVKTSKYQPKYGDEPCRMNHLAVKQVELSKELPDLFVQVLVHLSPPDGSKAHVHLCNWIACDSAAFRRQAIQVIPNANDCRGYWIPNEDLRPISELVANLKAT